MRRVAIVTAAAMALLVTAAPARADNLIIPFFGVNSGGDSGKAVSAAFDASQFNWGVGLTFMGGGVFGAEGDFSYSPDFYGKTDVGGSHVFTTTGNLVIGVPFGGQHGFGIRPYGVAGLGVMTSNADFGSIFTGGAENDFAWSSGGGIMLFFGTRTGVRFDFRYFRTFEDLKILGVDVIPDSPGKLDFTRSSIGFILRF